MEPYDVRARLEAPGIILGAALSLWEGRDDSRPQPEVRQAANRAMDTIDAMLGELHAIRSRLTSEIRASDDATATRQDAMLAELRAQAFIFKTIDEVVDAAVARHPAGHAVNGRPVVLKVVK